MNVFLFAEALYNKAGIERMTVELANLLSKRHLVTILLIDPFDVNNCPFNIDPSITVISLNSSFSKSYFPFNRVNLSNVRLMKEIIKSNLPDVLITVATPLVRISAPAIVGLGIRHIAWEHFNLYAGSKLGSLYKMLATWFVDATVVLTKADCLAFKKVLAPRVYEIPNFTTIDKYEPSKCEKKVLLAVGRHAYQKGFDMLVKAWSMSDTNGWKLRIVGSGADKSSNVKLATDLGVSESIDFVDATSHIENEFQNASCFILSSRFEGLVLVLIEAKMMGLPCISFDCPNSPREVIRDGVDGILVTPEDVMALSRAISTTLQNHVRLKEMGKNARKDALSRYSSEAVAKKWEKLITNKKYQ